MDVTEENTPRSWRRRLLVRSTAAVIVLCAAAMAGIRAANHSTVNTGFVFNLTMTLGLGSAGVVLIRKVPANPISWLMAMAGATNAVVGLGREWAVFVVVGHHDLPGAAFGAWMGTWPNAISLATLPLVLILFPDGTLPTPRLRPVVGGVIALMVVSSLGDMVAPGPFTDELPGLINPFGLDWAEFPFIWSIGQVGFMAAIFIALVSLAMRARRATPETRQQLKWVFGGAAPLCVVTVIGLLPWRGGEAFLEWAQPVCLVIFLAAIAVAVQRFRLWDLELLVRMSLVYGVLVSLVTVVYVAVAAGFGQLADSHLHIGPSLVAAALGAAVFALLRDRVQRGVERMFYGDRGDPYKALSRLGERFDQPVPVDDILDEVVDAVANSLRLGRVSLVDPSGHEIAVTGVTAGAVTRYPLMFRDTQVGELVVTPRPGTKIRSSELKVISDLARPVAAVVHAMSVTEELRRSRRELITAREAERRKIRRNLHDGLGPALAAVRMKLDSAAMLLDNNPDAAKAVIDQLGADIRTTITDIRRLVYDLQPPELDEVGLLESIAEQARSFSGPLENGKMLQVELHAPGTIPSLPAAVEVAAYRIVCEALANVSSHSGASMCRVDVRFDDCLTVEVEDNGVGLPATLTHGVGTLSMEERATELGGTFEVSSPRGRGTRVTAVLPIAHGEVEPNASDDVTVRSIW